MTNHQKCVTHVSLVAAPFTPMSSDGEVNLEAIELYAEKLVRDGVSAIFVGGTTGEGMSLSIKERLELASQWKSAIGNRMGMIVHVGHTSLPEAAVLARHAEKLSVDGIAAIGPTFFAPSSPQALVSYCQKIAGAAPGLPFYYYHMPSMSRVAFAVSDLFGCFVKEIPTFKGIKFTHEDMVDYKRCLDLAGNRYEVFFGRDELLIEGVRLGARSAVGSTYNFAAPLYLQMSNEWLCGDRQKAAELQKLCTRAIEIMVRYNGLVGIKSTMSLFGVDCGSPRLPLSSHSHEQIEALRSELEIVGYFKAINEARELLEVAA